MGDHTRTGLVAGQRVYPHYRRNFVALVADFAGFGLGFAFYSPSTVLPAFVSELTSSAPLIGLISTLLTGAWLLPQLFAANILAARDRRRGPAGGGRLSLRDRERSGALSHQADQDQTHGPRCRPPRCDPGDPDLHARRREIVLIVSFLDSTAVD